MEAAVSTWVVIQREGHNDRRVGDIFVVLPRLEVGKRGGAARGVGHHLPGGVGAPTAE